MLLVKQELFYNTDVLTTSEVNWRVTRGGPWTVDVSVNGVLTPLPRSQTATEQLSR